MTIPNDLRDALDRLLDYAMPDEKDHYDEVRHNGCGHIYEDMLELRKWLNPALSEPKYSLGINNDDGDCFDIAILSNEKPLATVIVPDAEVAPLLHAGNCFHGLVGALEEILQSSDGRKQVPIGGRRAARRRAIQVLANARGSA